MPQKLLFLHCGQLCQGDVEGVTAVIWSQATSKWLETVHCFTKEAWIVSLI